MNIHVYALCLVAAHVVSLYALAIRRAALRITPKLVLIRRAEINQSLCTIFLHMCRMQLEHRGLSFTLGFSDNACLGSRHDVFYCFFEHVYICYDLTMEPLLLQEGATFDTWKSFQTTLDEYSKACHIQFCCVNSRTVVTVNKLLT